MWANKEDLLIGDTEIGSLDASQYLDFALREINSVLGVIYVLPIPDTIPDYQKGSLRTVQAKLATGRLLMAQGSGAEDTDINAYGKLLIQEAYNDLNRIGNNYELLTAVRTTNSTGEDRTPLVSSADKVSPFNAFYDMAYGGVSGTTVNWGS
jgi:hypothetical protein